MDESNLPYLEIKPKNKEQALSGYNCIITLDGKEIKGLRGLQFELYGGELAKVTFDILCNTKIEGSIKEVSSNVTHLQGYTDSGNCQNTSRCQCKKCRPDLY